MANTRSSAKRARQTVKKQTRNQLIRSKTKTAVRAAIEMIKTKDVTKAKAAYLAAVKALGKAASKHGIPSKRAARKMSRLTLFAKKLIPDFTSASK